jgi:hypothetical protein
MEWAESASSGSTLIADHAAECDLQTNPRTVFFLSHF